MYRIGKYEVHNWVTDGSGTFRLIVDSSDKNNPIRKRIRLHKAFEYIEGVINPEPIYEIWFEGHVFEQDYCKINNLKIPESHPYINTPFIQTSKFKSMQSAKDHIDDFLNKFEKLRCFL